MGFSLKLQRSNMFPTQEPLVLCTEFGQEKGTMAPRHQVHRDGSWHISVNLLLWVPDQGWLMQKRSAQKDTHPNAWDVSASSHLNGNESPLECALRGAKEELGIQLHPSDLKHFAYLSYESQSRIWWDREWQHCYWALAPNDWTKYSFDPREVESLGCAFVEDMQDKVEHPELWKILAELESQIQTFQESES